MADDAAGDRSELRDDLAAACALDHRGLGGSRHHHADDAHGAAPNGETLSLTPALSSPQVGRYAVAARFDQPGLYRLEATATRAGVRMGAASRQVLVGGADLEMAQPQLNEAVLRRFAAESKGHYVPADRAGELPELLRESRVEAGAPEERDLWHNGWSFLALVGLLGAEWLLRRRAGLA